ncbi:phosphoglycerate mutase family protein [Roseivirga sp. BDSF3-8]|uniref:phosphoglycerate mutase family protein n=1 Tax=Roseivirga sp. BDSF3-8 TaxID=3241598 RepID=UPI00353187B3
MNHIATAFCLTLLFFISLTACEAPKAEQPSAPAENKELTTLILVRHAEKVADGSEDPALTPKGEARAALLADMLSSAEINAIYSTPYRRNIMTVQPLADRMGMDITEYDPRQDPAVFINNLLQQHEGAKVLIAGHSNTVPHLLNALLGESRYQDLPDSAYNNLYVVSAIDSARARITTLQFEPAEQRD